MAKDLIVEIGTEEMPAGFLRPAITQLNDFSRSIFESKLLDYEELKVYATPRRLVLYVKNLEEFQKSQEEEIRGPAEKVAYKDGKWLLPAIKFCQQYNADINDLYIKKTEKGSYVYLRRKIIGKKTKEILPDILKEIISKIRFPKMMKWGDVDFFFGRPIRWLLILFGDEIIDLEIAKVKSSNFTLPPRFLPENRLIVKNAKDYFNIMENNYVILDQEKRKNEILREVESLAKEKNFILDYSEDLLEEITFLVEYPTAFLGEFDKRYLNLPKIVLKVTMEKKQRYFPLTDSHGKLVNFFIGVRNGLNENLDIVKKGNEKVLKARLSDAEYYLNEDIKEPLEKYNKKLSGIIFHEKLGSIKDKVERVKKLVSFLEQMFELNQDDRNILDRAVEIYKADLGTLMVSEYPELHGIMGSIYARYSGERNEVAEILKEYILPLTPDDPVSNNFLANLLGISDRIDSLVGYFSLNLFPTGSEDPIGLRRLANGLIRILWEREYDLCIKDLFSYSYDTYNLKKDKEELWKKAEEFFIQRFKNFLIDKDYPFDFINAVLELGFDPIWRTKKRLDSLVKIKRNEDLFEKIYTSANRISRIIPQNYKPINEINEKILKLDEERRLYNKLIEIKERFRKNLERGEYIVVFMNNMMVDLTNEINNFFDKVLVMSEVIEERNIRLSLLFYIKELFWNIADWSKIVKI